MLWCFLLYSKVKSAICIHIFPLSWISFPFKSLWDIEQSSMCCTVGSHQSFVYNIVYMFILYIVVYICQSRSPSSSQPPFPTQCPCVCSLYLCLSFCFANRFICTILLDSYICIGGDLVTKSCLTLSTRWTVACQASLSMGFSRQEYWSGLPFPSPGDLPNPGIKPRSPALQADSLLTEL